MTIENSPKGLEGVVAVDTALCDLDGANGRLAYRGYDITDLAKGVSYEEVAHLLWHGELPTKTELASFKAALGAARPLPDALIATLRLMPKDMDPMRMLQASTAILGGFDPDATDNSREANLRKAVRLTSQLATTTCAFHRIRNGQEPIAPSPSLSLAGNFLYMLSGEMPSEASTNALNTTFVFYAEHELNASTFTTRVISSTFSDMHSAVAGSIGALKGVLHGGAGEKVLTTVRKIESPDLVEKFVDDEIASKRKMMGFGHRVYKAGDPRSPILHDLAQGLSRGTATERSFLIAEKLHQRFETLKGLKPNVDYYSALVWHALEIPDELFTPVIVAGRVGGWIAHVLEQHQANRLIRPRARYTGPGRRPVPR